MPDIRNDKALQARLEKHQKRLRREMNALNRPLSNWLQRISAWASIVFAGLGIAITIYLSTKPTEVSKMDDLLAKLDKQISRQDVIIDSLSKSNIQNSEQIRQNGEQLGKLSGIQDKLVEQNRAYSLTTRPFISLGDSAHSLLPFAEDSSSAVYYIPLKNIGNRKAENVKVFFDVYRTEVGGTLHAEDVQLGGTINPGQNTTAIVFFKKNKKIEDSDFQGLIRITLKYKDEFGKKMYSTLINYYLMVENFKIDGISPVSEEEFSLFYNGEKPNR